MMKKFVIEYWFRRHWFEKDFDEIIIIAKSKIEAIKTFKKIGPKHYKFHIVSETPLSI
jgi:hypothetical protein